MANLTPQELELIQKVHNAGISFVKHPVFGNVELSVEEVALFLEDPDGFMARYYNVSTEQFRAWRKFTNNDGCQATTKKGKPCSVEVEMIYDPVKYKPGVSDYCYIHQNA